MSNKFCLQKHPTQRARLRERDEERGGGGGGGCGGSGGGGGGKPVEAEEGAAVETDAENSTEVREGMRHAGPKAMARDQ